VKITDVKTTVVNMPFVWKELPKNVWASRVVLIVRVTTDEGITGIGESSASVDGAPAVMKVVENMIKPLALGKDPMAIDALWNNVFRTFYYTGRGGIHIAALSGFETALWDIKGKALNVPVYQLLGGPSHDKLRAYASLAHYTSAGDVAKACEKIADAGFTALKLHETDPAYVAAGRKGSGEAMDLMVDVNCRWSVVDAIRMGRLFEPYNLYWYEEPIQQIDDYAGLAEVRAAVSMPIASGENEYTYRGFTGLIEKGAADYFQPAIPKIGGISQQKKVFTLAGAFGQSVVPWGWAIGPAQAAMVHVCFSDPGAFLVETPVDKTEANLFVKPLSVEKGYWKLPDGPGLGIELDEKVVKKYSVF
jgi:L-alanine-DL-glutamate epimerase-like enolase superfamily enzyme